MNYTQGNNWLINLDDFVGEKNQQYILTSFSVASGCEDYVMVNGSKIKKGILIESPCPLLYVYVINGCHQTMAISMTFSHSDSTSTLILNYDPSVIQSSTPDIKSADKMINGTASYSLLRTNPLLTGNIKVAVTDKGLYLDTFKVSNALSEYRRRKISIDENGYYGTHVMNSFSDMPSDELYKVEDKCYDLFSTSDDFTLQHYTTYNCGARTNTDSLYSENISVLAPICINDILPDFFLVFRVNGDVVNGMTSEYDKISHFIKNGVLVHTFDMREGSRLGKYIRNIQKNAKSVPGEIFVAYDQNKHNSFNGISVDDGTVTRKYESVFDERGISSQVGMNAFYSNGFKRNRMISANVINLDFLFNDDVERFSSNTYFGLYVKLNTIDGTFNCIGYDEDNGKFVFNKHVHSTEPNDSVQYDSLIYGYADDRNFHRLFSPFSTANELSEYVMKPFESVYSSQLIESVRDTNRSFITFKIKSKQKVGTHLKHIDKKRNLIHEVIIVNPNDELGYDGISPMTENGFADNTMKLNTVRRVCVGYDENETIGEQADRIYKAFTISSLRGDFTLNKLQDGTITIVNDGECIFERIIPSALNENDNSVLYFDRLYPEAFSVNSADPESLGETSSIYPFGFELTGSRLVTCVYGISIPSGSTLYEVCGSGLDEISDQPIIYKTNTGEYVKYEGVECCYMTSNIPMAKTSRRFGTLRTYTGRHMVSIEKPATNHGTVSFYKTTPLSTGVCSILQIKDFDYDILDSQNGITYIANDFAIGNAGEYSEQAYNGSVIRTTDEEDVRSYIDGRGRYQNQMSSDIEREGYFGNLAAESVSRTSLPMICPTTMKWVSNGTDDRCMPMRVMWNEEGGFNGDSYAIPSPGWNGQTLGFCYYKWKYLENDVFPKYLAYSMDSIVRNEPGNHTDNVLNSDGRIDEVLYDSHDYGQKFSRVYSSGPNRVEFISGGVKITIKSSDDSVMNTKSYDGYRGILISVPENEQKYSSFTELIVDETEKQIALIWHQNVNCLYYDFSQSGMCNYRVMMKPDFSRCSIRYINGNPTLCIPNDCGIALKDISTQPGTYICLSTSDIDRDYCGFNKRHNGIVAYGSICDVDNQFIYADNISIYINGEIVSSPTNASILNSYDRHHTGVQCTILSATPIQYLDANNSFDEFNSDLKNMSIFVKKESGAKDYSTLRSVVEVKAQRPMELTKMILSETTGLYERISFGYVVPTFASPKMKDMLSFERSEDEILSRRMGLAFDDANVTINGVSVMNQYAIRKITDENTYCITDTLCRPCFDIEHNHSIMNNSAAPHFYRKYYWNQTYNEDYYSIDGNVPCLCENNFLNSKAISLKEFDGDSITLTVWKDSRVYSNDMKIRLNITDTIINHIRTSNGFSSTWSSTYNGNAQRAVTFIKKNILPYIKIDESCAFELYSNNDEEGLRFDNTVTDYSSFEKVTNFRNELREEGGKIYMYVYPEHRHTYYAKLKINL